MNNKKTPEWKEYEKLIAKIEKVLSSTGVQIKSPDFIYDEVSKLKREVDVSIRYRQNNVPVLITIECRRRTKTQDVTWIEQLITKKDNINASKTIAVSLKGFSKGAIRLANARGIELKTCKKLNDEEILSWTNDLNIFTISLFKSYESIEYLIDSKNKTKGVAGINIQKEIDEKKIDAVIAYDSTGSKSLKLNELLQLINKPDIEQRVNIFDENSEKLLLEIEPNSFYLFHDKEKYLIKKIKIMFNFKKNKNNMNITEVYNYSESITENQTTISEVAQSVKANTNIDDTTRVEISFIRKQ